MDLLAQLEQTLQFQDQQALQVQLAKLGQLGRQVQLVKLDQQDRKAI